LQLKFCLLLLLFNSAFPSIFHAPLFFFFFFPFVFFHFFSFSLLSSFFFLYFLLLSPSHWAQIRQRSRERETERIKGREGIERLRERNREWERNGVWKGWKGRDPGDLRERTRRTQRKIRGPIAGRWCLLTPTKQETRFSTTYSQFWQSLWRTDTLPILPFFPVDFIWNSQSNFLWVLVI